MSENFYRVDQVLQTMTKAIKIKVGDVLELADIAVASNLTFKVEHGWILQSQFLLRQVCLPTCPIATPVHPSY